MRIGPVPRSTKKLWEGMPVSGALRVPGRPIWVVETVMKENRMISRNSIPLSFVAAALALAPLAAGCTTEPAPDTGDLLLMLSQPGPHGEIYHLGNATFDIVHNESG